MAFREVLDSKREYSAMYDFEETAMRTVASWMNIFAARLALRMKHWSFRAEQEVRLIRFEEVGARSKERQLGTPPKPRIEYPITMPSGRIPLARVMLAAHAPMSIDEAKTLVRGVCSGRVRVERSTCPLRPRA